LRNAVLRRLASFDYVSRLRLLPTAHSTHILPALVALPMEAMLAYTPPQSPYTGWKNVVAP
jgi:hypothetical protein